MRISTQLTYAGDVRAAADQAVALEKAGLDLVWVAEAYGFDAVSLLGYLAARTDTVELGSGILPIYSRTPALLAQTAAGLDYVSGGRFVLGLGASGPQVIEGWHGVPYADPVGRTREIVDICRRVWKREVITNDGAYAIPLPPGQGTGLGKPLKLITHPLRERIPVWVASLGPKNVEMTAEVADGWLPILFVPDRAQRVWGEALRRGQSRRDPSLAALEIAAGGMVAIGDDVQGVRDLARPMVALYVGGMGARGKNFYNDLARRYGFEREAQLIQDLYLDGKKKDAADAVPEELLEGISLLGPAGYVKERIAAYKEAGVTMLTVTPIGPNPAQILEQVKGWAADA